MTTQQTTESQPSINGPGRYTIGRRVGGQYYVFDTVENRIKGDRNTRALAEALIKRLEAQGCNGQ